MHEKRRCLLPEQAQQWFFADRQQKYNWRCAAWPWQRTENQSEGSILCIRRAVAGLLGTLACLEHFGLLWWGTFWPWQHLAQYPGDGGVNQYMVLASGLLVCVSLAAAAAVRHRMHLLPWLAALAAALPVAVGVLLAFLNLVFLDPVMYYLALLPAVAAILLLYWAASRLSRNSLQR